MSLALRTLLDRRDDVSMAEWAGPWGHHRPTLVSLLQALSNVNIYKNGQNYGIANGLWEHQKILKSSCPNLRGVNF